MNTTALIVALLCSPFCSAYQLRLPRLVAGVRGVVHPTSSRRDLLCVEEGVEEGNSHRTWYERLFAIPSFPKPFNFKTFVADQLNAESSDTGRSLVADATAIVAMAGNDFKAGQKILGETLGEDFKAGMKILGLALVSVAALLSSSLSMEFKWALAASGLASVLHRQRKAKYDEQVVLNFFPASPAAPQAPTSPSPR
jgi:hypothetical protein